MPRAFRDGIRPGTSYRHADARFRDENSSGDEIANVNFYAVRPEATRIIIIIITRLMTHVKVIHRVKNRKCGLSRISEGKLGCKVQSLPIV